MAINNSNIKSFSSNLTSIKDSLNTSWSGEASLTLSDSLSDSILALDVLSSSIEVFNTALGKLEKYKENEIEIANYERLILTEERYPSLISNETYFENGVKKTRTIKVVNTQLIKGWQGQIDSLKSDNITLKSEIEGLLLSIGAVSDSPVMSVPNLEGADIVEKYEHGCIYKLKTDAGLEYEVYIPNKYVRNIPLVVYDAGDGWGNYPNNPKNWELWKERFSRDEVNSIIIRSMRKDTSSCYEDVIKKLNIEPTKPIMISHSGGTPKSSIIEYNDLMDAGLGKNGLMVVMDGNTPGWYWKNQGYLDKFKENDTIVLGFIQGDDANGYGSTQKTLAKLYPNVLLLYDKSEYGNHHGNVNRSLTENEVYEYIINTGKLPDNYEIRRYSPDDPQASSDGFVTVDYEDVSTIENVYELFGVEYK